MQVVADVGLAHGHADGQRREGGMGRVRPGIGGHGVVDHAHLGAVSVGDDYLVSVFCQVGDGPGSLLNSQILFRKVFPRALPPRAMTMRFCS